MPAQAGIQSISHIRFWIPFARGMHSGFPLPLKGRFTLRFACVKNAEHRFALSGFFRTGLCAAALLCSAAAFIGPVLPFNGNDNFGLKIFKLLSGKRL